MKLIMNILHHQGHKVPSRIDEVSFYRIAVLCDKYDLSRSLGPWAERWSTEYIENLDHPYYQSMLFIEIVFNLAELFTRMAKQLITNVCIDYDTSELIYRGSNTFAEGVPHEVIGIF